MTSEILVEGPMIIKKVKVSEQSTNNKIIK